MRNRCEAKYDKVWIFGTAVKRLQLMNRSIAIIVALALAGISQPAYTQDQNAAEQRAKLANQRIQAEADRRAREELAREQAMARQAVQADVRVAPARSTSNNDDAGSSASASPVKAATVDSPTSEPWAAAQQRAIHQSEMSVALEQIRSLGELRDAGYVTEAEFAEIKQRILSNQR